MAQIKGHVGYSEEFIRNSRGMKLLTCKWFPVNQEPRALIFFCHGYAMDCSTTTNDTANKFGNEGYAVYGIEYEGHGKSDGLSAYIENFDDLIDDVLAHFSKICEMGENRKKKKFLMGESMGGAVVLLLHRKKPDLWDGAILLAPMCKIADNVKPSQMVISVMETITNLIPTWRSISMTPDIIDLAFRRSQVRQMIRENPRCYKGRPRMKTSSELYRVSIDLEQRLHEVTMPLLVLHGEEDKVTAKETSKQLYEVASTKDKTLRLYPGMWHSLLYGELPENAEMVYQDIFDWLGRRISQSEVKLEENKMSEPSNGEGAKSQL